MNATLGPSFTLEYICVRSLRRESLENGGDSGCGQSPTTVLPFIRQSAHQFRRLLNF